MTIISKNQKCQVYDPMMIFKVKTEFNLSVESTPINCAIELTDLYK